jgi:hypothetical protein
MLGDIQAFIVSTGAMPELSRGMPENITEVRNFPASQATLFAARSYRKERQVYGRKHDKVLTLHAFRI